MPPVHPIGGIFSPLPSLAAPSGPGSDPPPDFVAPPIGELNPYATLPPFAPEFNWTPIDLPLTSQEQLWQINSLLQTGSRNEHMGILFIFGQYAAKACTLEAAMPALWLSPDYASLCEHKRILRDGGFFAGGVNLLSIYAFPLPSAPLPPVAQPPPPAAGGQLDLAV